MTWFWAAALCLAVFLVYLEGARRSRQLQAARYWLLGLGLALPLLLGVYIWQVERGDCAGLPPRPNLNVQAMTAAERLVVLTQSRAETSAHLARCGGTKLGWALYLGLEQLITQAESEQAQQALNL